MRLHLPRFGKAFPPLNSLLLAVFFVCVVMIWMRSLRTISTRADTSYPESALVQTARLASDSGRLYPGLDTPPYTPAPYGSIFYLVLAEAGKVCKGDAFETRLLLRSIVFCSYMLLGLMGYLLARTAGASRSAAILGAAAIWAAPQLWMFWNVSVRPDFPGLLLSLLGIWVVSRRDSPGFGSVILSGVCCGGAILIKQSFVAAPLAISLFFILRRSYRNFAVFAASGFLVGLLVIGYLTLRGEPVMREILVMGHSRFSLHDSVSILYSSLSVGLGVMVVAGGVVGALSGLRSMSCWQSQLFSLYFLLALLFATVTLLNVGSNANYLFEFWTIAAVLATAVVPAAETIWSAVSQPMRIGAAIGLLLLAVQSVHAIRHPAQLVTEYNFERLHDLHILSSDPSLTLRGTSPELLDPWLTNLLEQRHVWNPSRLLDEIKREEFDIVFVDRVSPKFSPAVLESLAKYYQPLCQTSTMQVMRPQNGAIRFSLMDASYTLREACE
jgi:hypothetical protein